MAGTSDDCENVVLSMVDVLEENKALEEEANAVLGASDDQNCTYPQGYVDRQALYSCLTCCASEEVLAGFCFACSLHCHDGHDLVELYTKRNFRCDCGNQKFGGFHCKLFSEKAEKNERNVYNQNFRGKYCTCHRPYPDPEHEIDDEMIQCICCEDWFHSRHLGTLAPAEYQEMVCDACMQKLDFLKWYKCVSVPSQETSSSKMPDRQSRVSKEDDVAQSRANQWKIEGVGEKSNLADKQSPLGRERQDGNPDNAQGNGQHAADAKLSATANQFESSQDESLKAGPSNQAPECKLESLKAGNLLNYDVIPLKASFWPNHWRKLLCKCSACEEHYSGKGFSFVLSEDDTVAAYEEKGKGKEQDDSSYEKGMRAFSSMHRINQVEALTEYNDMKSELHEFLKTFAGEGKVVTKEDIENFFAGMKAKKRRRLDDGTSMQYHCK